MRIYFELLRIHLRRKLFMLMPNAVRVRWLREDGVRIGEGCLVHTPYFSTEPWMIEIGDRVAISAGTQFITHDASGYWICPDRGDMGIYGRIRVGSGTFFGINCLVLPGTTIGKDCVIGSASVVRGVIPDGSVVMGNPGEVVLQTRLLKALLVNSRNKVDTRLMTTKQKRAALEAHFGIAPTGGGPERDQG